MYWQRRFDRRNSDQEIEEEMLKIRSQYKDYGYLRMTKELWDRGFHVNKKKVQRLIRKLSIEVRSFTRKYRRYNTYRGRIGMITKIEFIDAFTQATVIKRLQQIRQN